MTDFHFTVTNPQFQLDPFGAGKSNLIQAFDLIAPFFDDFVPTRHHRPDPAPAADLNSDTVYTGHQIPDGTLRFTCLANVVAPARAP